MPKAKKKALTPERVKLMNAVKDAKSEQEKRVANQQLKMLRFKEVGTKRLNRVLKALKGLENLANRGAYGWEPEQAEKIVASITKRVLSLRDKFAGTKAEDEVIQL